QLTALIASLIAQRAAQTRDCSVVRDDEPALAGSHLLVGIKGKAAGAAERSNMPAVPDGADRLTCIFNDGEIMLPSRIHQPSHVDWSSKDVNGQERFDRS